MNSWREEGTADIKRSPISSFVVEKNKKAENCKRRRVQELQTHLKELNLPGWSPAISRPSAALEIICLQLRIIWLQPSSASSYQQAPHSTASAGTAKHLSCSGCAQRSQCLHPACSLLSCPLPTFITLATDTSVLALLFSEF